MLNGEGIATVKYDGSCCAFFDANLYKRYDAKNGKKIPDGAIPCQGKADSVTGHFPCWVKCSERNPADKWFIKALHTYIERKDLRAFIDKKSFVLREQTYEAIGKHFQGNPYGLDCDCLIPHGTDIVDVKRDFDGIYDYLQSHYIEGLVFWKDGKPQCKIKRSDFGLPWACKDMKAPIDLENVLSTSDNVTHIFYVPNESGVESD